MNTVLAFLAFATGLVFLIAAFVSAKAGRIWMPGSRIESVDRLRLWVLGTALMAIGLVWIGIEVLTNFAGPNLLPFSAFILGRVLTLFSGTHSRPWRKRSTV